MRNNSVNKTFIFITLDKFIIISLDEVNKINYQKEITLKKQNKIFDLDLFSEFLNENIFRIEKELGEYLGKHLGTHLGNIWRISGKNI